MGSGAAVAVAMMGGASGAGGADGATTAADRAVQSRLPPLALGGSAAGQGVSVTAVEARLVQAEARAATVCNIRGMPDKPLALLYKMVDYMKVWGSCRVWSGCKELWFEFTGGRVSTW
jgi:hypothetical protein